MKRVDRWSAPGRLAGVDVARALAVIGMFWAHTAPNGRGLDFADGHPTVLFATLAGVSLGLLSGGAHPVLGSARRAVYRSVAIRAVLLIVLGRLLWSLGTPIAVILDSYGALFLVMLPALFAARAALAGIAAFSVTAGSLLIAGAGPDINAAFVSRQPLEWPGQWLLTGFYPVAILAAYAATGLICARSDLTRRRTQLVLLVGGAVTSGGGYLLAARLGVDAAAHANNGWEAVASGGLAVAVIGGLQLVCGLRPVRIVLSPLADTGTMPLTIYTAQVVLAAFLIAAVPAAPGTSGIAYWWFFGALTAGSIVFAVVWRRLVGRGPLEQLFADVSGSSRPSGGGGARNGRERGEVASTPAPPAGLAPVETGAPSVPVERSTASGRKPPVSADRVAVAAVVAAPEPEPEPEPTPEPTPTPGGGAGSPALGSAERVADAGRMPSPRRRPTRRRTRVARGLTLLGVRRRPVAFLGLVLLTGGAVVVSVCAPLLLRAAQQSSLGAVANPSTAAVRLLYSLTGVPDADLGHDVVQPSSLWRASDWAATSSSAMPWSTGGPREGVSHLVSTYACTGIAISQGRCPEGPGEVAVPDDSDAAVGDELLWGDDPAAALPLVIVGRYRQTPAGGPFEERAVAAAMRSIDPASRTEDLLVQVSQLIQLPQLAIVAVPVSLRSPLRLEDVAEVRTSLAAARRTMAAIPGAVVQTPIAAVIARQEATAGAATLIALALAAQTLAVAWAAQALLVGGIARSRAGEWGVARLRGFRGTRRVSAIFAEPLLAVAVGAVLGGVAAILLSQAIVAATSGGLVQPFEALPLVIGALAVAGCVVALVLASVRSATLPLAQLLRERTEPRRIGRLSLVAQSGVVLATGLVLYSVVSGGRVTGPQLPLLAPALVAGTIGLLALRIAVPLLRRRVRGAPRSLFGLLVGRRVVRTPSLLATAVVICVAVALATTALQTAAVSGQLQHRRAEATVGAARVLDVAVPQDVDLLSAVRRADPSGTKAMAALDVATGIGQQRVVAVDASRIAAVSSWDPAWGRSTAAALQRRLAPDTGAAVRLTGSRLALTVTAARMQTGSYGGLITVKDLALTLRVQNTAGFRKIELGRLGNRTFTADLPCASGCRVVDLTLDNRGFQSGEWGTQFVVASMRTDRQSAAQLASALQPDRWRRQLDITASLNDPARSEVERVGDGMRVLVTATESKAVLGIAPVDAPQAVPVLLGPSVRLEPLDSLPGTAIASGLGFEPLLVHPVGRAAILPRALAQGVLMDLATVQKVSDPGRSQARPQVWLSASAGASTVRALRSAGLRVLDEQRLATAEAGYLNGTVPRVAGQGAAIGLIGLALALLALLVAQLLRRPVVRATAEVLRAAGAPAGRVRRIAIAESALPAAAGALLGAIAGVLGAAAVLPSLPLGAGAGALPPIDYTVTPLALLLPLAVALVAIAVIAVGVNLRGRAR